MKYFKNDQGEIFAYGQMDLNVVDGIAELKSNLQSAQLHLADLTVPEDVLEDRETYETARRAVIEAQGKLDAVLPVFFSVREKLKTLTEMSQEDVKEHLNPAISLDQLESDIRAQRDALLSGTDWVSLRAQELQEPIPDEWLTYRQALRDITKQPGFPENIEWPEPPK